MRFLLLALLISNIHCMSVQKKGAASCVQQQIDRLEQGSTDFAKQREALGMAIEGAEKQFVIEDEDCKAKITFVKERDGSRVELVYVALDVPTNVPVLAEVFGRFKPSPPTPAGKWSTIARVESGNGKQSYAIIADARQKITDKTLVSKVTIRIDYED